jgi:hypothetical protein
MDKTQWLDIRGNHDNFNVQHLSHPSDLFRNFSSQGKTYPKSYLHQEVIDDVTYNFLALDASIEPGTKRPYNFIGMLDKVELERVRKMIVDSKGSFTIWFAHYPTSTVLTPPRTPNIRKFIGQFESSVAYLSGHLHTMGRLVNRMYALHAEGFLELELGDFLRTRRFRLAAIDHGLISIFDLSLQDALSAPFALITNPKNVLLNNPFKEDIELQRQSTHIRILAFSTSEITKCQVAIDAENWQSCTQKSKNFFVIPWNPSKYKQGLHQIKIFVEDSKGRIFENAQEFALDNSRISFDFFAKFILMSDLTTLFQIGYASALILCSLPLIVFKIWQMLLKCKFNQCKIQSNLIKISLADKKLRRPMIESAYWRSFVYKYLLLASINRIYFGLVLMILWTTIGPWSFHEVLDGHVGFNFLWGIFVQNQFVPGTLNYWYGFHQLLWFQFPLMIILAGVLKRSYKCSLLGERMSENETILTALKSNILFVGLVIAEATLAVFYVIQNGFFAFLIAPLRVWSMIFAIWLFYQAYFKISDTTFKNLTYLHDVIPKRS